MPFFPIKSEAILNTMSQMFAAQGKAREVAIVASAESAFEHVDFDNWNGGTNIYEFNLQVPVPLFSSIQSDLQDCKIELMEAMKSITAHIFDSQVRGVNITPSLAMDEEWRDNARVWLAGSGINNQGRVRSDNIASREADGLLFRSQPEINLYRALKALGVPFAPLPVFVRGGADYKRIEPDFIIIKDGIFMMVEVDGDTVHHETPAEAHERTSMLAHEGAQVERVSASNCDTPEKAVACAKRLIEVIEKTKARK